MTILIAEDTAADALILRNIVARGGHDIHLARDGEEALRLLSERPEVQLVLADVRMPGLDGVGLLRAMRGRPELSEIPVLFVSGVDDAETIREAASLAPAGYILKPLREPSRVLGRIESVLEGTVPFLPDARERPELRAAQVELAERLRTLASVEADGGDRASSLEGLSGLVRSAGAMRLLGALEEGGGGRPDPALERALRGTLHALEAAGL